MQHLSRPIMFDAKPSSRRRHGGRRVFRLLAIDALLFAMTSAMFTVALVQGWSRGGGQASTYVTIPVVRGDLRVVVHATGTVEPTRLIEVSTELTGTLRHVHARPNDRVKIGDVLAELDPASELLRVARAEAGLAAARARLKEAQATLPQANSELERKRALIANRITTQRDVDMAETTAQRARASIETLRAEAMVAEADLKLAQTNLAKTRILSPVDGIILRRNAEPGQAIAGGLQPPVLFRLAETLERMQIRVDVDEADAMRVQSDQPATFSVQALRNQRFPARVERIHVGPEIVQGVVTYKAVLAFDNRELQLKPGMTASADIAIEEARNVLLVPMAALRFEPGPAASDRAASNGPVAGLLGIRPAIGSSADVAKPTARPDDNRRRIFIVDGSGELRAVSVQVGANDGTLIAVTGAGLAEGQRVAVDTAGSAP